MTWTLLSALILAIALAVSWLFARRAELARMRSVVGKRATARETGSHAARLQHPHVDLSRCIGCGTCVRACPEEGVLELVHGQAVVVHGARCVGHGRCAAECPVGAIALTLGDVSERRDLPALDESLESPQVPGLFLAGEVTGYALVRTAIAHGSAVADEVARRARAGRTGRWAEPPAALPRQARSGGGVAVAEAPAARANGEVLDLVVVGAGPAGLACSLRAKELGLASVTLEQDAELGGTVAKYPRRKLVMTQPVDLPLHGRLKRTSYTKEELIELWRTVARTHDLPLHTGHVFEKVERLPDGTLRVHTSLGTTDARHVCLALGRRGTPRRLGVPGEDLPKVAYSLLDAHSYHGQRILVVGGGDSAVEAALGLAEQPGNRVTMSYRKNAFFRLKSRNDARMQAARAAGTIDVRFESEVQAIEPEHVVLALPGGESERIGNDHVFVFAGGTPPTAVLEASGISFDPADRPAAPAVAEGGTGLLPALLAALGLALLALAWVLANARYYMLPLIERPHDESHAVLSPSGTIGLACGIAACVLMVANLSYLARRSGRFEWIPGSLRRWMTSHVFTGILALLMVLVHAAMQPRATVGGHALWALAALIVTGAIGRYFYSFVPRAANGRELELDEVRSQLGALSAEWDRGRDSFAEALRTEVDGLIREHRWEGSFLQRVRALVGTQRSFRTRVAALRAQAEREGIARDHIERMLALARRAQRTALMSAHYEDVRAILASWRWFHRWVALGMVLLVILHVAYALRYAEFGS